MLAQMPAALDEHEPIPSPRWPRRFVSNDTSAICPIIKQRIARAGTGRRAERPGMAEATTLPHERRLPHAEERAAKTNPRQVALVGEPLLLGSARTGEPISLVARSSRTQTVGASPDAHPCSW